MVSSGSKEAKKSQPMAVATVAITLTTAQKMSTRTKASNTPNRRPSRVLKVRITGIFSTMPVSSFPKSLSNKTVPKNKISVERALIAVVLGAPTSEDRFALAKQLLDFGFAGYRIVTPNVDLPHSLPVTCGVTEQVKLTATPPALLLEKGMGGALTQTLTLPDSAEAPVKKGQQLGTVEFAQNGVSLAVIPILAAEDAKRMDFLTMLNRILTNIFSFL